MFAVAYLPHFSLQAVLRHEPELWTRPVALMDGSVLPPLVCDATPSATEAGVHRGLSSPQALARCEQLLFRPRSLPQEIAAAELLLQCAYGFSPNLELTKNHAVTLDLRGLGAVSEADPQSLHRWAEGLRQTLTTLQLRASIGVGATPGVAHLAAQWSAGVVTDAKTFVASLPVAALEPSPSVGSTLKRWGIASVGELLALGQEAVSERIGLEAWSLFAAASTTTLRPLNLVLPSERFVESFDFEHEIETLEPILFILRRFADSLSQRLELAHFVAETFLLRLQLDADEVLERELRLPQPTRDANTFFRTLSTCLETLRTSSPVKGVLLRANPVLARQKQLGLFETVLRDPRHFKETLGRLSALLGADRVGTPVLLDSHRPDAFRLLPPDFEGVQPPTNKVRRGQPVFLRRFRPPLKASVETDGDRPATVSCAIARGKLKTTLGPWRLSGHWWEPGRWQTEEWDVATTSGTVLRLSRRPTGWFVDAVLD